MDSHTERNTPRQRVLGNSLVVDFDGQEGRQSFKRRIEQVRNLLTPPGKTLDNYGLMAAMFDLVERFAPSFPESEQFSAVQSFNRDSGKWFSCRSSFS